MTGKALVVETSEKNRLVLSYPSIAGIIEERDGEGTLTGVVIKPTEDFAGYGTVALKSAAALSTYETWRDAEIACGNFCPAFAQARAKVMTAGAGNPGGGNVPVATTKRKGGRPTGSKNKKTMTAAAGGGEGPAN